MGNRRDLAIPTELLDLVQRDVDEPRHGEMGTGRSGCAGVERVSRERGSFRNETAAPPLMAFIYVSTCRNLAFETLSQAWRVRRSALNCGVQERAASPVLPPRRRRRAAGVVRSATGCRRGPHSGLDKVQHLPKRAFKRGVSCAAVPRTRRAFVAGPRGGLPLRLPIGSCTLMYQAFLAPCSPCVTQARKCSPLRRRQTCPSRSRQPSCAPGAHAAVASGDDGDANADPLGTPSEEESASRKAAGPVDARRVIEVLRELGVTESALANPSGMIPSHELVQFDGREPARFVYVVRVCWTSPPRYGWLMGSKTLTGCASSLCRTCGSRVGGARLHWMYALCDDSSRNIFHA
jgi:hypothetical protein